MDLVSRSRAMAWARVGWLSARTSVHGPCLAAYLDLSRPGSHCVALRDEEGRQWGRHRIGLENPRGHTPIMAPPPSTNSPGATPIEQLQGVRIDCLS